MATALQTLIVALHARVSDTVDPALKQQLADALDQHAAEQAEIQQLRDDYAGLKGQLDAFTGGGDIKAAIDDLTAKVDAIQVPDLGPLTDGLGAAEKRLDALEARNSDDDAAAASFVAGSGAGSEAAPAAGADGLAGGQGADSVTATTSTKT